MATVSTTFATASYDKIQSYIDSGVLKYPSYVLCKDEAHKNNLIFIDKELNLQPVKGYEQDSIIIVDTLPTENIRTNAFYVCGTTGYLYINGVPVPVFKEITDAIGSYDELSDVPFVNLYGEPTAPIVVGELEIGSYMISGNYTIGGNLETTFSTSRKVMFTIDSDEENKYITRFDSNSICVYTVNISSSEVTKNEYATQSWIKEQGFATENYVNQAIENLYKKIAEESMVLITKLSQLENDCGYLTAENINGIGENFISDLF